MGDYRKFLRVLENKEAGGAVMFEYSLDRSLAEQLIWRRGEHLWNSEDARVRTLIDAAHLSGFDCAVIEFAEDGELPAGLEGVETDLPEGIKLVGGLQGGIAERVKNGVSLCHAVTQVSSLFSVLLASDAVCAVVFRDNFDYLYEADKKESLFLYQGLVESAHQYGKPCIFADCSHSPLALPDVISLGVDAVHITEAYQQPMPAILSAYHRDVALLGDTSFSFLATAKPCAIIEYILHLQALTENRGYAFGTGNISSLPLPYLNFISVLSALKRGK